MRYLVLFVPLLAWRPVGPSGAPSLLRALYDARAPGPRGTSAPARAGRLILAEQDDDEEQAEDPGVNREMVSRDSAEKVQDFRAQLLRNMLGGADPDLAAPNPVDALLGKEEPKVRLAAGELAAGQVLVAHPSKFFSRNPFSQPVQDLSRFGLQGQPDEDLPSDVRAGVLPVLLLLAHGDAGSRALLLERRSGALMGDVSMDDYGSVAINPLWLGGTSSQNSLSVVHDLDGLDGQNLTGGQAIGLGIGNDTGLQLGGWADVRKRVEDRNVADSHFKFFLGFTEWRPGQLAAELEAGAWFPLEADAQIVIRDRVMASRPGRQRPFWKELMESVSNETSVQEALQAVYPDE